MKTAAKLLPGLGIVVIVIALAVWPRSAPRSASAAKEAAAVPVTAAKVALSDVPIVDTALGTVQPIEAVNVQSRVNGQIMQVSFKQGEVVKEGDPLFLIDPRPYQAALDQAQAQLQHDQALLKEAQTDLARYQKLVTENSIAQQEATDQAFVVQQDEGTVKLDEANVETAKLNLSYCHIDAPAAGVAGALLVDPGNYVQAGSGTTLVNITQLQPIYVAFPIPQDDLAEVRAAQAKAPLDVHARSQAGKPLTDGKLSFIANQVAAATGTVTLYAEFPNPGDILWPGEFVTAELVLGIRKNAITVPVGSVMSGPDGDYVYVVGKDAVAHRVDVLVVDRWNGLAVVEKGLSPGEEVVTNGQYRLADNVKVEIQTPAKPTG